jgi:hypothetical protein
MSVKFKLGSVTAWLQNPDLGDTVRDKRHQALAARGDGKYYRYALALGDAIERELHWDELRRSERDDLLSFFQNQAEGILNDFLFLDERGTWWSAHFLDTELEFATASDERATSGTFVSGGVDYPTTTRSGGTYSVTVRLRLWT